MDEPIESNSSRIVIEICWSIDWTNVSIMY